MPAVLVASNMSLGNDERRDGMHRILVATDGSGASDEAVRFGLELAEEYGAKVYLVHVVAELHVVAANGFGVVGAVPRELTDADSECLVRAEELADEAGVWTKTNLLRGDVVNEIVALGDNLAVDLIVVGSRGHGALANALLGSVSRGVLAESRRPVAVVRAPLSDSPAVAS
jgi:nucleotide-binding universal stress UspA family protein